MFLLYANKLVQRSEIMIMAPYQRSSANMPKAEIFLTINRNTLRFNSLLKAKEFKILCPYLRDMIRPICSIKEQTRRWKTAREQRSLECLELIIAIKKYRLGTNTWESLLTSLVGF